MIYQYGNSTVNAYNDIAYILKRLYLSDLPLNMKPLALNCHLVKKNFK